MTSVGAGAGALQAAHELADWGTRAAAFVLDLIVIAGIALAAVLVAAAIAGTGAGEHQTLTVLTYAIGLPIGLAYAPLMMARRGERNGQTLGKQAMRIRVVRESGAPMTVGTGLLREVIGRQLLSALLIVYPLIDYLWPLWDRHNQALHDKVAQTRVVRVAEGAGRRPRETWAPPRDAAPPAHSPSPPPDSPPAPSPPRSDEPVRGWLPPSPGER